MSLAERDRGLRLPERVAELAPDRQRPLKVAEGLGLSRSRASAKPSWLSTQASPSRSPGLRALSAATRWVVTQSAQLFHRLNTGNRVGGSRQATSCRPVAAAWRVATTTFARSSSYQARASSMLANSAAGSPRRHRLARHLVPAAARPRWRRPRPCPGTSAAACPPPRPSGLATPPPGRARSRRPAAGRGSGTSPGRATRAGWRRPGSRARPRYRLPAPRPGPPRPPG